MWNKAEWLKARDAELAKRYQEGVSLMILSEQFGIGIAHISSILKQQDVPTRSRGRPKGFVNDAVTHERNERIAQLYQEGLTLETIGQKYGLTRERIRQIIRTQGVSKTEGGAALARQRRIASKSQYKEAFYLKRFGHTKAEHLRLLQMDHKDLAAGVQMYRLRMYRFRQARSNLRRTYGWTLTLAQWWAIWEASGLWHLHGRGAGLYGMVRLDRSKGFELGNVEIREFRAIVKSPRWTKRLRAAQRSSEAHQSLREAFEQAALEMGQVSEEDIQRTIKEYRQERKHDALG